MLLAFFQLYDYTSKRSGANQEITDCKKLYWALSTTAYTTEEKNAGSVVLETHFAGKEIAYFLAPVSQKNLIAKLAVTEKLVR